MDLTWTLFFVELVAEEGQFFFPLENCGPSFPIVCLNSLSTLALRVVLGLRKSSSAPALEGGPGHRQGRDPPRVAHGVLQVGGVQSAHLQGTTWLDLVPSLGLRERHLAFFRDVFS